MSSERTTVRSGFVVGADEGAAFWFLNTLTINKVESAATQGRLCVVDHRVPPGFAPPPHVHEVSDEVLFVVDGEIDGFCGDTTWHAGPGSLIFLPNGIPHGFQFSQSGPGRLIIAVSPAGFEHQHAGASVGGQAVRQDAAG